LVKKIKIIDSMSTSTLNINSVRAVVNDLLLANNTCTTLEVKNELRKREPRVQWNQADVSNIMDLLHQNGVLTYRNLGTYRIYSAANKQSNIPSPSAISATFSVTKVKKPKKLAPTRTSIGKNAALAVIQGTNNKFFGVTFTKKDGTERKMVCRLDPQNATPTPLGYLRVIDTQDGGTLKNLNLQTLTELRLNNTIYTIK